MDRKCNMNLAWKCVLRLTFEAMGDRRSLKIPYPLWWGMTGVSMWKPTDYSDIVQNLQPISPTTQVFPPVLHTSTYFSFVWTGHKHWREHAKRDECRYHPEKRWRGPLWHVCGAWGSNHPAWHQGLLKRSSYGNGSILCVEHWLSNRATIHLWSHPEGSQEHWCWPLLGEDS